MVAQARRRLLETLPAGAIVRPATHRGPRYVCGLDLGQSSDYTALAVAERGFEPTGRYVDTGETQLVRHGMASSVAMPVVEPHERTMLRVRFLHRFELNTDYVVMAGQVAKVIGQLPREPKPPALVIDHTGVGRGVFDIFRHARMGVPLLGVTITGGQQQHQDPDRPWEWSVPKKDLVSALQVVVQSDRLRVAPALPLAGVFAKEMQQFRIKVNSGTGNMSYQAWREGDHDDTVLSVALCCWATERMERPGGLG